MGYVIIPKPLTAVVAVQAVAVSTCHWRSTKHSVFTLVFVSANAHIIQASVNGFNSRCLHVITCQGYRVTSTAPECDMLLAIRQRRLRYLGHILRMPESRVVRRTLVALAKGGTVYPKGSLFMDCQAMGMDQLVALAQRHGAWNVLVKQLHWDGLPVYHYTIGPPGSAMEIIHTVHTSFKIQSNPSITVTHGTGPKWP